VVKLPVHKLSAMAPAEEVRYLKRANRSPVLNFVGRLVVHLLFFFSSIDYLLIGRLSCFKKKKIGRLSFLVEFSVQASSKGLHLIVLVTV
jgi:hypothetical protein